jgi:hypothetical protein
MDFANRLIDRWLKKQKSSPPGTIYGGPIVCDPIELGPRILDVGEGIRMPTIAGGTRQYFMDTLNDPPIANLTAVTATAETILWNVSNYTPIAANDCRPGKIYKVTAGGIWTNATTGTLLITPRFGLTVAAGITMGANINAQTVPGSAVTSNPWELEFNVICRTVGAPGVNSTVIGTGYFATGGLGTVGTAISVGFGGTSATVDVSIATGICFGWTLSVAGSVTPMYAFISSLN